MPLNRVRSTTLTAAVCSGGIRLYTRTGDGDVREGCNNTTESALTQAKRSGDRSIVDHRSGWFPGELRFNCSPGSALCAFAWATWSQSVFYQTEDGYIRERRNIDHWEETSFVEKGCLLGTNVAAVHSSDATDIYLFFQDDEGYLCYRYAYLFRWNTAVRLGKAAKYTGIGATTWNDCQEIRVYFQDEDNIVREYRGSRNYWTFGDFTHRSSVPIGNITAVSWCHSGVEIRVYFQEENSDIVEWYFSAVRSQEWALGSFRQAALPNSDIAAYIRNPGPDHLIVVMWAGPDQILWQKVDPAGWGWMDQTPIAPLQATGKILGSWTEPKFNHYTSNVDTKVIRQLRIRYGEMINGLAFDFTDETSTAWHGGNDGILGTFRLSNNEDFTHVLVTANDKYITALQFITSKGRKSKCYGQKTGSSLNWELDGRALAGFMGSTGRYVNGLMPIWSERYSLANLTNLRSCITEAEHVRKEIELTTQRCSQLHSQTEQLRKDTEVGLRAPANHAIEGVGILSDSIMALYDQTKDEAKHWNAEVNKLVKHCKGQAAVVASRFHILHEESTKLMNRGGELSTELTAKLGESEQRMTRLKNLQEVADGLRKGAEAKAEMMREKKKVAKAARQNAEATKKEAGDELEVIEDIRLVRDIFTFGIGHHMDWFDLNEDARYYEKLVESCERNLQRCQDDLQAADESLKNITNEVKRFVQLRSSVDSYKIRLQENMNVAQSLRSKSMELTNSSHEISLFLGGLVARTETIQTKFTAAQFAKAVIAVEQLLVTSTKVKGLLRSRPSALECTMEMIAHSDAVAEALGDLM